MDTHTCLFLQRLPGVGLGPAKSAEEHLEEVIATLRGGSVGSRSAAAEKLYNEAARDETATQRAVSLEVVPSLVSFLGILRAYESRDP